MVEAGEITDGWRLLELCRRHQVAAAVHLASPLTKDVAANPLAGIRDICSGTATVLAAAREDYLKAIELSPPYQEVRTNLGQCYRQMGHMEEAVAAYSAALDLDPSQVLALVGRAQAYEALGQSEKALADYGAALTLDFRQPKVLANRAVLLYEASRFEESLADLTAALELSPDLAELYQNRSVVLTDLQRYEKAAQDLRDYLRLNPAAEDRDEVLARLRVLDADQSVA